MEFDLWGLGEVVGYCRKRTDNDAFSYIVTPNVDHLVRLDGEREVFSPLYQAASLRVCDSRILQVLAKKSGFDLPLCPGSDLTEHLFDNIISQDEIVNIIGGDDELVKQLVRRYGLNRINHHQPPMGLRNKPNAVQEAAEFIAKKPARFTFICVGSPQQEMIAKAALDIENCKGFGLCVGASLDFLTGRAKRAPKFMQNLRLEWLYRLLSEPKRMWRRYLIESPKIFFIWRRWQKRQSFGAE